MLRHESFWSVKSTTAGSWMWKKLLKYRPLAASFCRTEVKNGLQASFWFDQWSSMGRLVDVAGERGFIDMGITKLMTVVEAWNRRGRRTHRQDHYNQMEAELSVKYDRRTDMADEILWKGKNDKFHTSFSTKDTWSQIRQTAEEVPWYRCVWLTHSTPKSAFCTWLAIRNRLSTGDRMAQWSRGDRGDQEVCVLCNNAAETRDHLFFSCSFSSEIWTDIATGIYGSWFSTTWSSIIDSTCSNWSDKTMQFLGSSVLQQTIYTLWHERNGRKHGDNPKPATSLIQLIDKHMRDQLLAIGLKGDRRYDSSLLQRLGTRFDT